MKIRIELSSLASKHQSGVAQYTRMLTEALSATEDISMRGHYFDFLKRQPKPSLKSTPVAMEPNTLIPLRVYAKLQSYGIAPAFDFFRKSVDLTIFPNFATWPTVTSKKRATVVHDLTYMYFPEATEEKNLAHLRRVVPRSIKKADFIITVSESVKKELVKEFNLNPDRCVTTPIPPDDIFFTEVAPSAIVSVKEKYTIPADKKYIYFIGNLEPRKNLSALIRAYCALPEEIKEAHCLVLAGGKGWKTEETEATLTAAQAAGESIHHIGFIDQEDSPALYQGASLFVMPSLYEGFGIPVLEAMAGGTPVVAADIPVLREVGMNAAHYANTADTVQFAREIQNALETTHSKQDLQENARRYSWVDNIDKIKAAYEHCK